VAKERMPEATDEASTREKVMGLSKGEYDSISMNASWEMYT
jgi:hypothetical protein